MELRNTENRRQILHEALAHVNTLYDGNACFNRYPETVRGAVCFTLRVRDSKLAGHRVSNTGRRSPSACWHLHRDFMIALFDLAPTAKLKSAMATYTGRDNFRDTFEDTGYQNLGSQFSPMYARDACDCGGS